MNIRKEVVFQEKETDRVGVEREEAFRGEGRKRKRYGSIQTTKDVNKESVVK